MDRIGSEIEVAWDQALSWPKPAWWGTYAALYQEALPPPDGLRVDPKLEEAVTEAELDELSRLRHG